MTDTASTWAAKFPHPGAAPPKPTGIAEPAVHDYNRWITAMRKHNIARSVDTLIAAEQIGPPLTAVETITLTVGMMILDGSIRENGPGIFGMLF